MLKWWSRACLMLILERLYCRYIPFVKNGHNSKIYYLFPFYNIEIDSKNVNFYCMYQTVKPRYTLSQKVIVIYEALLKELISWISKTCRHLWFSIDVELKTPRKSCFLFMTRKSM